MRFLAARGTEPSMRRSMLNGVHPDQTYLQRAFESGFLAAGKALFTLTDKINHSSQLYHGFHRLDSPFFARGSSLFPAGGQIITTEVFGDITGKSYLLLSAREMDFITAGISLAGMKEAYIKELDNILSASVITQLSNHFQLRLYGDIPTIVEQKPAMLEDLIRADFHNKSEEAYLASAAFKFDGQPEITPFFVWVMDSRIQHALAAHSRKYL